jgi:hypothetical protein
MLSPNGSSDTCISDGVFHIPLPCFHSALPVYPKVFRHSSMPLSRRTDRMPQLARCFFPLHAGPPFVDFRFFSDPYDHSTSSGCTQVSRRWLTLLSDGAFFSIRLSLWWG